MTDSIDTSQGKAPEAPATKRAKRPPLAVKDGQKKAHETSSYPMQVKPDDATEPEGALQALKFTDIIEFNQRCECEFVVIAKTLLAKHGAMRVREMCIETAARLDISIETAKRYLLKHSASIKEFTIEKGWVQLRKT